VILYLYKVNQIDRGDNIFGLGFLFGSLWATIVYMIYNVKKGEKQ